MEIVFFNYLSLFFTNNEKYNYLFRHLLYSYCKDFQNEIYNHISEIDYNDQLIDTLTYIEKMKENKFFAGDFELSQAVYFLI